MKRKKYLGQHFLNNKNILNSMLAAGNISKKDTVLEAGPGLGSLTLLLAERAKKVITIEKDSDLMPFLKEKFLNHKNVKIIEGDILKISEPKSYKIVANIPYYITSHFLRKFLEAKNKPKLMVLMIQKEVAERIIARDGKESLLSISVKAFGTAEIIRTVPRGAFSPPPDVDSAIIKISGITDSFFKKNKLRPDIFFGILRSAFQQKRKMLRQSIGKKIKLSHQISTKRPEELSLSDWALILHN